MARVKKVGVRILDAPYTIDREYSYYTENEDISVGGFVLVPFGKANKKKTALITSIADADDYSSLKPIDSKICQDLHLDEEFMGLCDFMCEHTFCSAGDAVRRFIPSAAFDGADEMISFAKEPEEELNAKAMELLSYIKRRSSISQKKLEAMFGEECRALISKLLSLGAIERNTRIKEAKIAVNEIVFPREGADERTLSVARTPEAYRMIYKTVLESDGIPIKELEEMGFRRTHIKALEKRGLIEIHCREMLRNHYESFIGGSPVPTLAGEQIAAYEKLDALTKDNAPHAALLYGVTGSGKTSVILSLCKSVLDSGRGAIVLVPEIGLTWQAVSTYAAVFGTELAIIHSSLSDGERFDAYRRIKRGEAKIVLGTRSAIFAPVNDLGLIVIDEEQEHTYKSDITPKYHARDIARYRAAKNGALMLLASATPSIESFYKAKSGIYELVEMKNRYGSAVLPDVIISDMRDAEHPSEAGYIGKRLENELIYNFEDKRQSMLFLNRRGYNSYVICRVCGEAIVCPKCSVSLTYHKLKSTGALICHYCGHRQDPPRLCPSCGSEHLSYGGYGTQLIEDEIKEKLPGARVCRMDADSIKGRFSQDDIVEGFAKGEQDIMLGTQMIAKGHNFPNVTLVGVLNADNSLFMDDFRANERTFSLITQVIGRAGRGKEHGRAVIQTMNPHNETIRLASKQDYDAFYEDEIAIRRALVFPPFCDITTVTFSSEEEAEMLAASDGFAKELRSHLLSDYSDVKAQLFGPFDMPIYKVKNKFRRRLVIKHRDTKRFRALMRELVIKFSKKQRSSLFISIDINPTIT